MDSEPGTRDAAQDGDDPLIGTVLQERYRVLERLAAGGMGVVYRGLHLQLEKTVAVKFLHTGFISNAESMQRFKREALTMSRLAHPNCVSVLDYGVEHAPFIVMDYVTGKTLDDELAKAGRLPAGRAIYLVGQILSALTHAHGQGLVHRDIKPENIMLSDAEGTVDHVFVLDFGLAKFSDMKGANITGASTLLGTPAYMSPEQTRGEGVGPESDLYSVGVLLFELLTGHRPFEAANPLEILYMHQDASIPRLSDRAGGSAFSDDLENVIRSALAKKSDERFASAAAFANALEAVPEAATYTPTRRAVPPRAAHARPAGKRGRPEMAPLALAQTQPVSTLELEARSRQLDMTVPLQVVSESPLPGPEPGPAPDAASRSAATVELGRDRGGDSERARDPGNAATSDLGPGDLGPGDPVPGDPVPVPVPAPAVVPGAVTRRRRGLLPVIIAVVALGAVAGPIVLLTLSGSDSGEPDADGDVVAAAGLDARVSNTAAMPDSGVGQVATSDAAVAIDAAVVPIEVKRVSDVELLIDQGRRQEAIEGANKLLSGSYKNNTYLLYRLGNLYFEVGKQAQGLDAYRKSLARERKYRKYQSINVNVIEALASPKTYKTARGLFKRYIKRDGLRYLRQAAIDHPDRTVRQRASQLADEIGGRR